MLFVFSLCNKFYSNYKFFESILQFLYYYNSEWCEDQIYGKKDGSAICLTEILPRTSAPSLKSPMAPNVRNKLFNSPVKIMENEVGMKFRNDIEKYQHIEHSKTGIQLFKHTNIVRENIKTHDNRNDLDSKKLCSSVILTQNMKVHNNTHVQREKNKRWRRGR